MVQWYPGHMARAKREIKENLKKVDLIIEVLDARIPRSSRNPELKELLNDQEHIIVLNKVDLAVNKITEKWKRHLRKKNTVVLINSLKKIGISSLMRILNKKYIENKNSHNILKVMIAGVTNSGKSTLINAITGKNKVKTGKKPGVTRGQQWIKVNKNIYLLDTPGILWPKFEDKEVGYKLALTGAINRDVFDIELVSYKLIQYLMDITPEKLEEQYNINITNLDAYEVFKLIGKSRGCLQSGGRIDKHRTANIILNDFQKGKFQRISLEKPGES
ncbi:MAG: ribosome biogenesis GTPase YlqF [Halanaerobiaceae bacterium]